MDRFFSILSIWSKISVIGILVIVVGITIVAVADLIFDLNYGYKASDLLIAAAIILITIFLYAMVGRIGLWVRRQ